MSAFQKAKLTNSLRVLHVLLGHAKEIQDYAGRRHGHVTIMLEELLVFLARESIVCILQHPHNNRGESATIEAKNFTVVLEELIAQCERELEVMEGGSDEAV